MLEKEFRYFVDHQKNLVKKYKGKFIVIIGEEIMGIYNTESEAYIETSKKHSPGTFLIQECIPGSEAYKQTFHSRVEFAQ